MLRSPLTLCVHVHSPHADDDDDAFYLSSGWRIHCGVEATELSTNKQNTLSRFMDGESLRWVVETGWASLLMNSEDMWVGGEARAELVKLQESTRVT
jgi:hypothetical protein